MYKVRLARLAPALYLVAGLLLVDLLVHCNRHRWNRYDADEYLGRVRECRRQRTDVVFVGGSPVSEGIDPTQIGELSWEGRPAQGVYNLGLPGGTATDVYHAVQRACPEPPRVLIYGITATDLNDSRNEPHGAQVLMTWGDYVEHVRTRSQQAEWVSRQFLRGKRDHAWQLYRYRNGMRLWCQHQIEQWCPGLIEADPAVEQGLRANEAYEHAKGFAPRPHLRELRWDLLQAAGWDGEPFSYMDRYVLGGHLRYLDKLADWCRARQVTFILVDMPVSDALESHRNPTEFALYRRTLREFVRDKQIAFVDASHAAEMTDSDFADLIHLNRSGSVKLAAWLKPQLERLDAREARR